MKFRNFIVFPLILLSCSVFGQKLKRFSISTSFSVGKDLQTTASTWNLPMPIVIHASVTRTKLNIEPPKRWSLGIEYQLNSNISLIGRFGQTYRALNFRNPANNPKNSCTICKLNIGINKNFGAAGLKFAGLISKKLFFEIKSGLLFSGSQYGNTDANNIDSPNSELINVSKKVSRLIHISNGNYGPSTISYFTEAGISYLISKHLSILISASYEDDLTSNSAVIIFDYDQKEHLPGDFKTYNLNFKTTYLNLKVTYYL